MASEEGLHAADEEIWCRKKGCVADDEMWCQKKGYMLQMKKYGVRRWITCGR